MSRKSKRRRERRRQETAPSPGGDAGARSESPERPAAHPAGAPEHRKGGRARPRRPRSGALPRIPVALVAWLAAGAVVLGGIAFLIVSVATEDSSSGSGGAITSTPDPRVAGRTPAATFEIEAGDAGQATGTYFRPDTITGNAGEVIEILVRNVGSVHHNLRVSGTDKAYETRDDFALLPTIGAGEEGRLLIKIDEPGAYPFRCDLHPTTQTGILQLR